VVNEQVFVDPLHVDGPTLVTFGVAVHMLQRQNMVGGGTVPLKTS